MLSKCKHFICDDHTGSKSVKYPNEMKICHQEQALMQEKHLFPLTEHVRGDEMKQQTLAEQIDAGRIACDTQWNYVDGWQWQGNGDRSASQTIDCYPLAQLNTTLHLYDKQLNCNPSTCLLLSLPSTLI